jgi:hypothetical protein
MKSNEAWQQFLGSLRVKTQLLKRLQHVIVVHGATHSQKDGMEGNRGSLEMVQRPLDITSPPSQQTNDANPN